MNVASKHMQLNRPALAILAWMRDYMCYHLTLLTVFEIWTVHVTIEMCIADGEYITTIKLKLAHQTFFCLSLVN